MEEDKIVKIPEKKFSTGAISAVVWKNKSKGKNLHEGEDVEFRTVEVTRRRLDKDGNWEVLNTFRVNDLPKVQLVVAEAYKWIVLKGQRD